MKEKIHIAILSLGICTFMGLSFANFSSRDAGLNSAKSSAVQEDFICNEKTTAPKSKETRQYKVNLKQKTVLQKRQSRMETDENIKNNTCDAVKGKKKTQCQINVTEYRRILSNLEDINLKIQEYEDCTGIDLSSGEVDTTKKTKKREENKEGTITTNLPGDNNDIVWITKDPNVRIKYLAPEGITTTVAVEGKNVIITPGIKTNMLVSGSLTPKSPINPARLLMYAGKDLGGHIWTHNGKMMSFSGLKSEEASMSYNGQNWTYASSSGTTNGADYVAQKIAKTITPDGLTDWTVYVGSGQPIVTALASNASQVISAVAADPVASTLLSGTLAPGNDGTGAISAMDILTFCASDSESSTCTDSDEGGKTAKEKKIQTISKWYEGEWSTCTDGKQTRKVECQLNGTKVADNKCEGKKPTITKACKDTTTPSINSDNDPLSKICTDTDGGYDIYVKGTASYNKWVSETDNCGIKDTKSEWGRKSVAECSGDNCYVEEVDCRPSLDPGINHITREWPSAKNKCPFGCSNGACKKS